MFLTNKKMNKLIDKINLFEITAIPNKEIDKDLILETIGNNNFLLIYNFSNKKIYLGFDSKIAYKMNDNIKRVITGFETEDASINILNQNNFNIILAYRQIESIYNQFLSDIFEINQKTGFFAIFFVPIDNEEAQKSKKYIENTLSKKGLKETISVNSGFLNKYATKSTHNDLFDKSEETLFFNEILNSLNIALISNNIKHKLFFIISKEEEIKNYLSSRFLILNEFNVTNKDIIELLNNLLDYKTFVFGNDYTKKLLNFNGKFRINYITPGIFPVSNGNIPIGTYMKNGVYETKTKINIDVTTMNLGFILTGLPGSGKTNEAMSIFDSINKDYEKKNNKKPAIVIISPTDEWNEFAVNHNMYLIKLFKDKVPINFFRLPEYANEEKFYSDLAMILSSASKSGPYENPMEKCMIDAFRQTYKKFKNPNPIDIYNEIENSIIKFHAKKNNIGVQYTKHGENIRSALENLRDILNRTEYSLKNTIKLEDLFEQGIVFDISNASNNDKVFAYALILNQIYSFISKFDTRGDNELRFIICIEEAQLIFEKSRLKESAAVKDLKFRMQDFRKRGVALMLLTHNVNNIDPEIRRLCQLKLYLKQSPDIAEIASKDLVFTYSNEEEIISKLKHLNSRIGAFNYIIKNNNEKIANDTIFIRTMDYFEDNKIKPNPIEKYLKINNIKLAKNIKSEIIVNKEIVINDNYNLKKIENNQINFLKVNYLNDEIIIYKLNEGHNKFKLDLINSRKYSFQFLNNNKRIIDQMILEGKKIIKINLKNNTITLD